MTAVAVGQGAGSGGIDVYNKTATLSTTVADVVTINGVGRRTVKVWNLHATAPMWVLPLKTAASTAAVAGVDNAFYVPPTGQTPKIVPLTDDNSGKCYLSVVGNANQYVIEL